MRESVGLPRVTGLLVRAVEDGSPAAEAGIRAGDVLVSAGGRELRSSSSLYAAIEDAAHELVVDLLRGSETIATSVRLTEAALTGRAATAPSRRGEHCL